MTSDHRIGLGLITDVLDVLERHGYARGDNEHAGRAIVLISDLARIYEGTQDHPSGPTVDQAPLPPTGPGPSGPDSRTRSSSRPAKSRLSWPRWISPPTTSATAPRCAPTAPTSPAPTCQSRLHDAQAYDQMADRCSRPPKPPGRSARASPSQPAPAPPGPHPAADKEAGQ